MRFTIRDLLWLMVVIALIVWSEIRHSRQQALIEAEEGKAAVLEGDVEMWEGRAFVTAQTLRDLDIPVTFTREDRGYSIGPIPPAYNNLRQTPIISKTLPGGEVIALDWMLPPPGLRAGAPPAMLWFPSMHSKIMTARSFGRGRLMELLWVVVGVPFVTCVALGQEDVPEAFRGESLAGWTTMDEAPVTMGWEASGGEIRLNRLAGRGGHIITAEEFGDFELSFEWKIAARGNSGLKYRVRKYGNQMLGLEYQICDEAENRPVGRKSAGALYDLYEPAAERLLKPAGEWNTARIVVRGDRIEHWLNGGLIVSASVGDDAWQKRMAESKFTDNDNFGENRTGRIMLTDHGSDVAYRKFAFRPLKDF